jgi:hypothetical protein
MSPEFSPSCRYAGDSLDAAELERGILVDDHPRAAVDYQDIADLRIGTVVIADPVGDIRPP